MFVVDISLNLPTFLQNRQLVSTSAFLTLLYDANSWLRSLVMSPSETGSYHAPDARRSTKFSPSLYRNGFMQIIPSWSKISID